MVLWRTPNTTTTQLCRDLGIYQVFILCCTVSLLFRAPPFCISLAYSL